MFKMGKDTKLIKKLDDYIEYRRNTYADPAIYGSVITNKGTIFFDRKALEDMMANYYHIDYTTRRLKHYRAMGLLPEDEKGLGSKLFYSKDSVLSFIAFSS